MRHAEPRFAATAIGHTGRRAPRAVAAVLLALVLLTIGSVPATAADLPPSIGNANATDVTPTAAVLSADVVPHGNPTAFVFQYGPDAAYGQKTEQSKSIGEDEGTHHVRAALEGLSPATTYHFRVIAINFAGTSHGPDQIFTTPDAPRVDSSAVSEIGQTGARISALVAGNLSPTSVHFEYGIDAGYGLTTVAIGMGMSLVGEPADAYLTGLIPGTAYHVRAVAENGFGAIVGPATIFRTLAQPQLPQLEAPAARKCKRGFVKRNNRCVKSRKGSQKPRNRSRGKGGLNK